MPLSLKQEMFVEAYLQTFNATKAALAAGYSSNSARQQGSRLLSYAHITSRIRERMEQESMRSAEVLYHLTQIARGDMDDLLDSNGNLDLDKARELGKTNLIRRVKNRAISTEQSDISETETEGYDRVRALELLGKAYRLFTDKTEVENSGEVTIRYVDDWRDDTPSETA